MTEYNDGASDTPRFQLREITPLGEAEEFKQYSIVYSINMWLTDISSLIPAESNIDHGKYQKWEDWEHGPDSRRRPMQALVEDLDAGGEVYNSLRLTLHVLDGKYQQLRDQHKKVEDFNGALTAAMVAADRSISEEVQQLDNFLKPHNARYAQKWIDQPGQPKKVAKKDVAAILRRLDAGVTRVTQQVSLVRKAAAKATESIVKVIGPPRSQPPERTHELSSSDEPDRVDPVLTRYLKSIDPSERSIELQAREGQLALPKDEPTVVSVNDPEYMAMVREIQDERFISHNDLAKALDRLDEFGVDKILATESADYIGDPDTLKSKMKKMLGSGTENGPSLPDLYDYVSKSPTLMAALAGLDKRKFSSAQSAYVEDLKKEMDQAADSDSSDVRASRYKRIANSLIDNVGKYYYSDLPDGATLPLGTRSGDLALYEAAVNHQLGTVWGETMAPGTDSTFTAEQAEAAGRLYEKLQNLPNLYEKFRNDPVVQHNPEMLKWYERQAERAVSSP